MRASGRTRSQSETIVRVAAPRQRHALGALFLVLTLAFAGVAAASAAGAGGSIGRWIVGAAAAAIAAWFATLAWQLLGRH